MPASCILYDLLGQPKFEFLIDYKNRVYWSKQSRFLCIGGFSSLDGELMIWDSFKL